MRRTPEPELMDEAAQARAYADADFSATDDRWVALFRERLGPIGGEVVDLGCGPGNLALRMAAAGASVVGVDGAEAMLAIARERCPSVRFVRAVLPETGLPDASFDAVVSNSLLHHLHDPGVLWGAVRALGRPGAAVLVGDLRRPADAAEAERLTSIYAADAPEVLRRDFHASLRAAFEVEEVEAQVRAAGLVLSVEALGDRHLLVWGRLPG